MPAIGMIALFATPPPTTPAKQFKDAGGRVAGQADCGAAAYCGLPPGLGAMRVKSMVNA